MSETEKTTIREALASLAAAHSLMSDHLERAISNLAEILGGELSSLADPTVPPQRVVEGIFVDDLTMSVHWRGSLAGETDWAAMHRTHGKLSTRSQFAATAKRNAAKPPTARKRAEPANVC